jgi:hypothetical protein
MAFFCGGLLVLCQLKSTKSLYRGIKEIKQQEKVQPMIETKKEENLVEPMWKEMTFLLMKTN